MKKIFAKLIMLVAVCGMLYATYRLYNINRVYELENDAQQSAAELYKPQFTPKGSAKDEPEEETAEEAEEPTGGAGSPATEPPAEEGTDTPTEPIDPLAGIRRLKADYSDAVGWIFVPGTRIDYPVFQGKDNEYYLRRGMDGNYLYSGTPFLDCGCERDLSSTNTIIYGHNLLNGKMFSDVTKYKSAEYAKNHDKIYLYTDTEAIEANVITCVTVDPDKCSWLYDPEPFADYSTKLKSISPYLLTDPSKLPLDAQFVTLSTCDYSFEGARSLLIAYFFQD